MKSSTPNRATTLKEAFKYYNASPLINLSLNNSQIVNIYNGERNCWELLYDETQLEALVSLMGQQVDLDAVFESRILVIDLVKASGGYMHQLMTMTAEACLTAACRSLDRVTSSESTYAIKQEQFNFERFLLNEDYLVLAQVCLSKNIAKNKTGKKLLNNLSILKYNGDNPSDNPSWYYINPVLKSSRLFQTALQNLL